MDEKGVWGQVVAGLILMAIPALAGLLHWWFSAPPPSKPSPRPPPVIIEPFETETIKEPPARRPRERPSSPDPR
jgi:hypothetical protein